MQDLAVTLVVAVAAAYLGRRIYRRAWGRGQAGCGCGVPGGGCGSGKAAVQITKPLGNER